ncbi:MAG: DUF2877 domain-containing protein [Hyphomicrobiaceae bacterium]
MFDTGSPFEYRAMQVGCLVSQRLRQRYSGRVHAVFNSTFYVEVGSQLICLGSQKMTCGPLNIVTSAPTNTNWCSSGVYVGAAASLSPSRIRIANLLGFEISDCPVWSPRNVSGSIDPGDVERGLARFRKLAIPAGPQQGMSRFLNPEYSPGGGDIVGHAALQPVADARSWLLDAMNHNHLREIGDPIWMERLVGLGPGLTPSGDDFVGGLMIGLHVLGETSVQSALWHAVRRLGPQDNAISLAHLEAAAHGLGSEDIHSAVSAIIFNNGAEVQAAISDIADIGACSGWDIMTGVATVIECWLDTRSGERQFKGTKGTKGTVDAANDARLSRYGHGSTSSCGACRASCA